MWSYFVVSILFQLCFAFKGHIDDQLNIVIKYTDYKYKEREEGDWFRANELSPYNGYVSNGRRIGEEHLWNILIQYTNKNYKEKEESVWFWIHISPGNRYTLELGVYGYLYTWVGYVVHWRVPGYPDHGCSQDSP